MYFSGTYDIFVDDKNVGQYVNSGSFGELALMYNMPRAATIVATTDGVLWAMVCDDLESIYISAYPIFISIEFEMIYKSHHMVGWFVGWLVGWLV